MIQVNHETGKITRLGITLRAYVYEVDGLLIDTGPKSAFFQLRSFFQKSKINQIALTHIHEDHSGNAGWWWKKKQISSFIHKDSVPLAEKKGIYPFYRRMYWGQRKPFKALPIPEVIETDNFQFQVIETPGHSADSISLFEKENGWIFTGDLFITEKPQLFLREESIPETINSLKKLLELDIGTLFCAHSGKINNGKKRLQNKLDYLLEFQGQVLELHQKGMSKQEIVKELFPKNSPMIFFSSGEFSYIRGVESIINND